MRIKTVEPFILHVPIESGGISDATNAITHWGIVGVRVETDSGLVGHGFTGTHAHLPSDRLIAACIGDCYAPLLLGEEVAEDDRLWLKLARYPAIQWVARAGIAHLSLAAVDIALWDIRSKNADLPLLELLGGASSAQLEAYNTDVGWLSLSKDDLVERCRRAVEVEGFRRLKIKVGQGDPMRDVERLEELRKTLDRDITIAVDANGKWDLATCNRFCEHANNLDVFWFEEPTWYDDVRSHAELKAATSIPIALGEQLYTADAFEAFLDADAVHYVQPDVTRLAGITEYIRVADAAHARHLPVVAHVGDMGQVHAHLSFWHPATTMLEYIPWIRHCFVEPVTVHDGFYARPQAAGAGSTLTNDAMRTFRMPLRG